MRVVRVPMRIFREPMIVLCCSTLATTTVAPARRIVSMAHVASISSLPSPIGTNTRRDGIDDDDTDADEDTLAHATVGDGVINDSGRTVRLDDSDY
jgi:hypothetical protein